MKKITLLLVVVAFTIASCCSSSDNKSSKATGHKHKSEKSCCAAKKAKCTKDKKSCCAAKKAKCTKDKKSCCASKGTKCTKGEKRCPSKGAGCSRSKCTKGEKSCCAAKKAKCASLNTLTKSEKSNGWILLFDGKTSNGWRGYKKNHFPKAWSITDGTIMCKGSGRGEAGAKDGGDIIFNEEFDNFHLKLEWKISEGGNSGIFYLGEEKLDYIWKTAPEMQILDNDRHPDALLGKDGNRKAGSLYDLIPAKPQNANPAGEWNSVEVICDRGTVVHKQNGETVLEYHLWTPEWEKLVAGSKFPKLNPAWAKVPKKGYIGLQDHGDDVWFRNIKIRKM